MNKWYEASDVDQLFFTIMHDILDNGESREPRGLKCSSIGPIGITLTNPRARVLWNSTREASKSFMAGEFTWIITGSEDLEQIAYYNNKMREYSDGGIILAGAYGPRLENQLPYVINLLKADPQTRQAIITIWRPNPEPSKDIPCTVSMHFRMTQHGLDLTTHMRSNDLWLGFPYDVFNFTSIQEVVAVTLNVPIGKYHHIVSDIHLYEQHFELAKQAVQYSNDSEITPALTIDLPALKNVLYNTDKLVRASTKLDIGIKLELSRDPFAYWIQSKLYERRQYHADRQAQNN